MEGTDNKNKPEKNQKTYPSKEQMERFGKQLNDWIFSDPDYAHRILYEGSGNW